MSLALLESAANLRQIRLAMECQHEPVGALAGVSPNDVMNLVSYVSYCGSA